MAKEIREATTGTGNQYPLEVCQSNQITYYSDIDQDGTVEKVRYFLNGTTIQRGVINPSGTTYNAGSETVTTVMDHILNTAALPIFSYFDGNYTGSGAALSFPVNCTVPRMINISLKIDTNTEVLPGPFSISTMVQFRNLKSNL